MARSVVKMRAEKIVAMSDVRFGAMLVGESVETVVGVAAVMTALAEMTVVMSGVSLGMIPREGGVEMLGGAAVVMTRAAERIVVRAAATIEETAEVATASVRGVRSDPLVLERVEGLDHRGGVRVVLELLRGGRGVTITADVDGSRGRGPAKFVCSFLASFRVVILAQFACT
jgi:hypothetical protein